MSSCRQVTTMLDTYVDGELSPDHAVDVESHLVDCRVCGERVRLEGATRTSLKRAVYAAAPPSDAFRERVMASLAAERERLHETDQTTLRGRPLSWSTIVPLAAAAAMALLWTATTQAPRRAPAAAASPVLASTEPVSVEGLLDDIVDHHLQPAHADVTEPLQLRRFEPEVGVPVRMPNLSQYGARWEGGSVVPLRDLRAASLRYRLAGHRMTLYVFNSERFPLKNRLEVRVVRNEPVYVGWKRGLSIAATERRGVGYAIASDLEDLENAEIVASLH